MLKTNLKAFKRALNPKYIWSGWVAALAISIITGAVALGYSNLIEPLTDALAEVMDPERAATIAVLIGLFLCLSVAMYAYSGLVYKTDNFFWRNKTEHLITKINNAFATVLLTIGYLSGVGILGWIISVAVISRITGQENLLYGMLVATVILWTLVSRVWFFPTLSLLMSREATSAWKTIIGATKGKTLQLTQVIVFQGLFLAAIVIAACLLLPVGDVLQQLFIGDATDTIDNIAEIVTQASYLNLGILIVISGPLLAIFTSMHVATLRVLVGVDTGDRPEKHFSAVQKEHIEFEIVNVEEDSEEVYNPGQERRQVVSKAPVRESDPFDNLQGTHQAEDLIEEDVFDAFAPQEDKIQLPEETKQPFDARKIADEIQKKHQQEDTRLTPPSVSPQPQEIPELPDMPPRNRQQED